MMSSSKQRFVGWKHWRVRRRADEGDAKGSRDGTRDVILNGKDIGHLPVVALGPEMTAVGRGDELCRHAEPTAGPANAALEYRAHTEGLCNPTDIVVLPLECERGGACDHLQSGEPRQRVDDLFGQTVAEVLVLLIAADVLERQDGDRRLPVRRRMFGEVVQSGPHFGHRLESLLLVLSQTASDDAIERVGNLEGVRLVAQHAADDVGGRVAAESAPPADQLVEDGAKAEDVRARVERLSLGLLGRHVRGGSEDGARRCPRPVELLVGIDDRGQTEIEELCRRRKRSAATHGDEDVAGLQVPVQNSASVRRVERAGNLQGQGNGAFDRHGTTQRRAVDVLEHEVIRADVVQLTDVGMVQRCDGPCFALKATEPVRIPREGLGQHFDRDVAVKSGIASLVYVTHPARAERPDDFVWSQTAARCQRHDGSPDPKPGARQL